MVAVILALQDLTIYSSIARHFTVLRITNSQISWPTSYLKPFIVQRVCRIVQCVCSIYNLYILLIYFHKSCSEATERFIFSNKCFKITKTVMPQ